MSLATELSNLLDWFEGVAIESVYEDMYNVVLILDWDPETVHTPSLTTLVSDYCPDCSIKIGSVTDSYLELAIHKSS